MNVAVGIDMAYDPPIVFVAPEKVCVPELAVYGPLFVKLPAIPITAAPFSVKVPLLTTSELNVIASATFSAKVAPLLIVTIPANVFEPVVEVKLRLPPVPPPTEVVPETFNIIAAKVIFALLPIDTEAQLSVEVAVPVIVPIEANVLLFTTAPVTVSVKPALIVNVFVPVNVKEARLLVNVAANIGARAVAGIITISPAAVPG